MSVPISSFFDTGFMPHGHCFFWDPGILWTRVCADTLIALAYFTIPAALLTLERRRPDLAYRHVFRLFSAFIIACGISHVFGVVTVWWPVYGLEAGAKAVTAGISVATAAVLWPIIPAAVALPSPHALARANAALEAEVAERRAAEEEVRRLARELEARVDARTEELAEANRKLVASNRDLELFAYAASHDLRAPLRTTRSYAELLQRRFGDQLGEDGATFVGFLVSEVGRMSTMVDGLLDFSRVGAQAAAGGEVDVAEALAEVQASLRADLDAAGARLEVGPLPVVQADVVLVRTLLQNLLSNAVAYAGDAPPRVEISAEPVGPDQVRVHVRDHGVGIDPAHHDEIFRIFRRFDTTSTGTGIGLAMCRRIVESHGGTLSVESTPGDGATFSFTLPGRMPIPPG